LSYGKFGVSLYEDISLHETEEISKLLLQMGAESTLNGGPSLQHPAERVRSECEEKVDDEFKVRTLKLRHRPELGRPADSLRSSSDILGLYERFWKISPSQENGIRKIAVFPFQTYGRTRRINAQSDLR
jgi:hypothetical protein